MRKIAVFGIVLVCSIVSILTSAQATPDLSQGVQVLAMLADPYGANTYLLKDQFERMGWEITFTGIQSSVAACSSLCSRFVVDQTIDQIATAVDYDVLVVMPTPGTFNPKPNPVGDLRESDRAIALVEEAFSEGLTLYTGCSGIVLFGDAGCLDGASVISHATRMSDCRAYGAQCTMGSSGTAPMVDGQLVTATNQRVWPLEIAAAIARSLDSQSPVDSSLESIIAADLAITSEPIVSEDAAIEAWTMGTPLSDVGRDVCAVADGSVVVGMTYSPTQREQVLVIKRTSAGEIAWAKAIGGPGRDFAEAVCADSDGNVYIAGYTTSAGNGMEDALVLKMSGQGDVLWAATVGGAEYDAAFDICPGNHGGVVLCGLTYSSGAGLSDLYVAQLAEDGSIAWEKTYGGVMIERGQSIQPVADGGYIVCGGTSSMGAGNVDMYLVRLSSTGDELWSKAFGRATYDLANAVLALRDGGFLLIGHGDKEGSEVSALTIVRTDSAGRQSWTSRLGQSREFDYGLAAVELDSGEYLIAGVTNDPSPGKNDVWLNLLADNGRSTQQYTFGGFGSEWPGGICFGPDGTLLIAGQTASFGSGSYDAFLLEFTLP